MSNFGVLHFEESFIVMISILALIFIVFNSCVKLKVKELKKYFMPAMKLNVIYFILCTIGITLAAVYIFDFGYSTHALLLGLLVAVLAYGSDPSVVLSFFKGSKNKIMEIIEIESIINTPITLILASLILAGLKSSFAPTFYHVATPLFSILQVSGVAIAVAFVFSVIVIKILKQNYFGEATHLSVLTSAIIVYVVTEYLQGSGVLAIAVFGVIFGNSHISHLIEIEKFESIFTNGIKIITFMILGTIVFIKPDLILKGTLLFLIYLVIRFVSVYLAFLKEKLSLGKLLFLTLNVPKGIDVAVVVILKTTLHSHIEGVDIVASITIMMIVYSIALSSITAQFSKVFLKDSHRKNVAKSKRN